MSGIMFQDITTLVSNHKVFKHTVDIFVDRYRDMGISVVAGNFIYFSIFYNYLLVILKWVMKKNCHVHLLQDSGLL